MAVSVGSRSVRYTSGIQKRSGTAAVYNKSKAAGIVVDTNASSVLKYNQAGTVRTLVSTDGTQTLTNKTFTNATVTSSPVASGGATPTVLAANSGRTHLFDAATSITYALPTPVVGMVYEFLTTVLETGGQAHIVTAGAGVFLAGVVTTFSGEDITPSATLGPKSFSGNGTTHIKTTMNGTTLGGGIGTKLTFRAIDVTHWNVTGTVLSPSGTIATPFST